MSNSNSNSKKNLPFAVFLALTSSVLWAIGNVVQKKGHKDSDKSNTGFLHNKTWKLGFVIYTIGSIIGGQALAYGSLAIVGSLESTALVWDSFLASYYLGEPITNKTIIGIIIVMIGCISSVIFGPPETAFAGLDLISEYKQNFFRLEFIIFMVIFTIIILSVIIVIKSIEINPKNKKSMKQANKVVEKPTVLLVCYILAATYFSAWNNIFQKTFFTILKEINLQLFMNLFFWFGLCGFVVAVWGIEYFKQKAMRFYNVVSVVPLYRVGSVISACLISIFYFGEFKNFPDRKSIFFFSLSIVFTLTGVIILTVDEIETAKIFKRWSGIDLMKLN